MARLENTKRLKLGYNGNSEFNYEFVEHGVIEKRSAKLIYYSWISKIMILLSSISLIYSVCVVLSILKLVPQIIFDSQIFIELSDSNSIVKREYIDKNMESREKIMVNFMKQYVEIRNTYIKDDKEMNNRWLWGGLVSYLSTYNVYKEFEKGLPKLQREMSENKSSRSVEILSVNRTGGESSNTWKIEFKTYDYSFETQNKRNKAVAPTVVERYWTANIRGYIDSNRRTAYRRLINPLGFVVYGYFQSEIEV